jgi:hypothetical protein
LPLQKNISRIRVGCGRASARPYHKKPTPEGDFSSLTEGAGNSRYQYTIAASKWAEPTIGVRSGTAGRLVTQVKEEMALLTQP